MYEKRLGVVKLHIYSIKIRIRRYVQFADAQQFDKNGMISLLNQLVHTNGCVIEEKWPIY